MSAHKDIEEVEIDMNEPDPRQWKTSDRFWHDKNGDLVVLQWPNKTIVAWFITFVLSEVIHTQPFKFVLSWTAFVLLVIWSVREIRGGVNYFRRSIGVLILLLAILTRF